VTEPLDRSMLAGLAKVVDDATRAFEAYDHARALEVTESYFWTFCDDYLELVKERAHGGEGQQRASAVNALRAALSVFVRLLAPFLPYATEETWSWMGEGSVHTAAWPVSGDLLELAGPDADAGLLSLVGTALIGVRGAKTAAKASQKTPVELAVVHAPAAEAGRLTLAAADLAAVGRITELRIEPAEVDAVAVAEIRLEPAEA
jgi:valyl-tRNA synthetase